jgi:hypothetical protein
MVPAVAVKVADVEPADTVTVPVRPGSSAGPLDSVTAVPPAGAAWLRVTVQVALVPDVKLVGLQVTEVTVIPAGASAIVAVCKLLPRLAVRVPLWLLGTVPAVTLNVAAAEPAATVMLAVGTGSNPLLLDRETTMPPVGAAWLRFTVQEALLPEVRLVGLQVSEEMVAGDSRLMVAVCETPPSAAVRVALWPLAMLPAVALKVVVAEPAWTVIVDAGTGSSALLLERETAVPPAGVVLLRFTAHVVMAPEVKLVGLQVSEETVTADTRLIVAVWVKPLRVAVSVALWSLAMLPAVAVKLVVAEPAGTVMVDTRTGSEALLLKRETAAPPAGAALFRVTVHTALVPEVRLVGLQVSEDRTVGTAKAMVAVCEMPFRVAVSVALWPLAMLPAIALKVIVAEPAGTVIVDAGTGSSALLLDSETAVPPGGAVLFRVTVHAELAPEVKVVGLHANEDGTAGASKVMVTVCDTPFSMAKIVALWLLVMLPAITLKVAVVEPAGTVMDLRAGSSALLLESATVVAPAGAAWLRFTVHVVPVPEVKLAALQDKEVSVGAEGPGPETAPPVAETANEEPGPEAATVFPTPTDVLVTPAAIIRFTIATVPFWMGVLFKPQAKQV